MICSRNALTFIWWMLLALSVVLIGDICQAENAGNPILLHSREIIVDDSFRPVKDDIVTLTEQVLWLVSYNQGKSNQVRKKIISIKGTILDYIPRNSFLIHVPAGEAARLLDDQHITWVGPFQSGDKYVSSQLVRAGNGYQVQVVDSPTFQKTFTAITTIPGLHVTDLVRSDNRAIVAVDFTSSAVSTGLDELAKVPAVLFIEPLPVYQPGNADAAWVVQSWDLGSQDVPLWTDGNDPGTDRLNGQGQVVAVCDTGLDPGLCHFYDETQPFPSEVVNNNHRKVVAYFDLVGNGDWDSYSSRHGTHVAGTIAGNDLDDSGSKYLGYPEYDIGDGMGMQTKLVVQDAAGAGNSFTGVPIDLNDLLQQAYDAGARIHSNSWGTSGSHYYTSHARHIDQFMWQNQDFLVVFLAGNDGNTPGVIWEPSTAKNCISVGATWNEADANSLYWVSSYGPTLDNRLKPTVVAPGVNLWSARGDTSSNVDSAWEYSGSFVDRTTAFNYPDNDVQVFDNNSDYILIASTKFGGASPFSGVIELMVSLEIPADSSIIPQFEYSFDLSGNPAWASFSPADYTSGFQQDGLIRFTGSDLSGWASFNVNEITGQSGTTDYFWIRITRTNGLMGTVPTENMIKVTTRPGNCTTTQSGNCSCYWSSGTSMATPVVAGVAALAREYFEDGYYPTGTELAAHGFEPLASLIKAIVINSGTPIDYRRYYDFDLSQWIDEPIPGLFSNEQGWGRPLLDNSLYFHVSDQHSAYNPRRLWLVQEENGILDGQTLTYSIPVLVSSEELKVTLVWTDYPSSCAASVNLVNNLDLEVIDPSATTYLGNVITDNYSTTGGTADDVNVEEQVILQTSVQGMYTISVIGTNVPFNPQPFALVVSGYLNMNPAGAGLYSYGLLSLDKRVYAAGQSGTIRLYDRDLLGAGTTSVQAVSTTEASPAETVTLTEIPTNSGYFEGTIDFVTGDPVPGDGLLQVSDGDTVTITYLDANDGFGNTNTPITATALINDTLPQISNVTVDTVTHVCVTISWQTDELANSSISYDTSVPLSNTAANAAMTTDHEISICDLNPCLTYYFAVSSTNEAGETATDDNGTAYYTFQTKGYRDLARFDITYCPAWTKTGDWECDQPAGLGGINFGQPDPLSAASRLFVFGNDLTSEGDYAPSTTAELTTAPLDFSLAADVFLAFQRWLNVEQGFYDTARIQVSSDGSNWDDVWQNWNYIIDDNWIKQEYNLTAWAAAQPNVQTKWVVTADGGLEMSGWNLDDVRFYELTSCEEGILRLDSDYYTCSEFVSVELLDLNLNSNPAVQDSCSVGATSDTMATPLSVPLQETGVNTARFVGTFELSPVTQAGTLTVSDGDTMYVTYDDADAGGGMPSSIQTTALIHSPFFDVAFSTVTKDAHDVTLNWTWPKVDPLAAFFRILRSEDPADFSTATENTTTSMQWLDVGAVDDTDHDYYYRVYAANSCGDGP